MKTYTRKATLSRTAADAGTRTFPASLSSETPLARGGTFEVLSHAPDAIDLSRAPLPLLEGHDADRINIGLVENLRIENRRLVGDLVLGESARATELAADIASGIVTGLSIGYKIIESELSDDGATVTATRWAPYECSIVAIPADSSVGINRSLRMNVTSETIAERTRALEIQSLATKHDLGDGFARRMIETGASLERVRSLALEELATRTNGTMPRVRDESGNFGDDFRNAAVDALLLRSGVHVSNPHPGARDLQRTSLVELARTSLSRTSIRHGGLSNNEILQRAMSSSDFPLILENAAGKSLRTGYLESPASHVAWTRPTTANDFKPLSRVILSTAPSLEPVAEGGEYTFGALDEDREQFSVSKFGRALRFSWESLVNDNLDAFASVPAALGAAARRVESDLVYALLTANALGGQTMRDGLSLFHVTHFNIANSGAMDLRTGLIEARTLLRRQKSLGGADLALAPKFLLVPPELESEAERLLAANTRIVAGGIESGPGFSAGLVLIVEPRLTDPTTAYLLGDHAQIDTVELAHLAGFEVPTLTEEDSFLVDARTFKVRHTVGARALDYRGMVRVTLT
ncbi:MAG: HK97 family phage prohead protease [Lysobacterales bacterium]